MRLPNLPLLVVVVAAVLIVYGRVGRRNRVLGWSILSARRWLARMTYSAGIVGLVGLGLFLFAGSGVPVGVSERFADYPSAAMVVVLGTYLLVSAVTGRSSRRQPTGHPVART